MIRIRRRCGSPRARKIEAARWQASRSMASGSPPCSSGWQVAVEPPAVVGAAAFPALSLFRPPDRIASASIPRVSSAGR